MQGDIILALLTSGTLFSTLFILQWYGTTPINLSGKIIYGIGCGLVTSIIRFFGTYNEGVSFAIILMNLLVPHIDNLTKLKPFGYIKEKKAKAGEAK